MKNSLATKYFVLVFVALNAGITIWHGSLYQKLKPPKKPTYTYHGTSIPLIHPISSTLPLASLTLQESLHYHWSSPDNATRSEWYTLLHYPSLSILGDPHRMTITSWYHNLHCISQIRTAIAHPDDPIATRHHFNHCLQYLRQLLLCGASDMLEKGDWMERGEDRVGPDVVCYDWEQAFATLQGEHDAFREWKDHGQPLD